MAAYAGNPLVERVEPILPASTPYITRTFVQDLTICFAAASVSLCLSWLIRRRDLRRETEKREDIDEGPR